MYDESVEYYDQIYSYKDYKKEARKIHWIIRQYKKASGNRLLDVACGTGNHITFLKENYQIEGLDVNPQMLNIARKKHPNITFHQGDMTSFGLRQEFDAITCLFSAIGFVKSLRNLRRAIKTIVKHLRPGGVLIVEPWFSSRQWNIGSLHAIFVNQPKLKLARISTSDIRSYRKISVNHMHYLIATPKKVDYFTEVMELGLFNKQDYRMAFKDAGLRVSYDPKGLIGRGLWIGVKPIPTGSRLP